MPDTKELFLSVVIPVYNEEGSVRELHQELLTVLQSLHKPYEIIFVDDGSTDGTLRQLRTLNPVRVFSFTRNFGKAQALQFGFREARGRYIVTMDGDLQDNPKEIPSFIAQMEESDMDLVCGWRKRRHDPIVKRLPSKIANALTQFFTRTSVHDMNCCFKIYKKHVAQSIELFGDMHRYIPALVSGMGYRIGEIVVEHRPRRHGVSKYGFVRFFNSAFDFITLIFLRNFTDRPMYLFGFLGTFVFTVGMGILSYLLYAKLFAGELIGNRPLLMLGTLLVLLGFQSFSIGFIGELVIRNGSTEKKIVAIKEHFAHEGLS